MNTNYTGSASSNPYCQPTSFQEPGIFQLTQQIPVYNLPLQIEIYADGFCQKPINSLLFPDGIAAGNSNFDSIFTHKGIEAALDSSKPNRLIIPDNQLGKGYSALIALMPHMKCNGAFCGDDELIASTSTFDYFIEVDYLNDNPFQEIKIPSAINLCTSATFSGYMDTGSTCSWDSTNKLVTVAVKPKTDGSSCSGMVDNICRSPEREFSFTLAGNITKTVYFRGEKNYGGTPVVRFSHFYEPLLLDPEANCAGSISVSGSDWDCASADILVRASFASDAYQVSDTTPKSLSYQDNDSNTQNITYYILSPDQWQQKDILVDIAETLGSAVVPETFKRYKNDEVDDEDHHDHPNGEKYGSIRRIREMFSPDGPASLFNPDTTCINLSGTKSITLKEEGETNNYEVVISNTDQNTPYVARPDGFCKDTDPLISTALCDSSSPNSGNYQKRMMIKKNGVLETVLLFDCAQKAGRYESLYVENYSGDYWREKELIYWNTEDSTQARYERYSINMQSTESSFTSGLKHKNYAIEKIYKKTEYTVEGEVLEYGVHKDIASWNQNINYTRFNLDDTNGDISYADYSFWEQYSTGDEFFPSSPSNKYYSLQSTHHASTQFCSPYQFPFSYIADCTTGTFPFANTSSAVHPLALSFTQGNLLTYEHVKPANLKSALSPGYFSISTW